MSIPPEQIVETLAAVRRHELPPVRVAVVLGSGLGAFADSLAVDAVIPYQDLPHFPQSTAIGHAGRLVFGRLDGTPIVAMQGRCHLYEGAHWERITYPIHVLQALGVRTLVLSCAAGGLSSHLQVGDLMVIEDHLNFNMHRAAVPGWLIRSRRSSSYCPALVRKLMASAGQRDLPVHRGVYIGVTGPNYETRAEQRMFRLFGDAIGMSTIPEAVVANALGIRTAAVATITNLCTPDDPQTASGDHVIESATRAEPRFRKLVTEFLRESFAE